MQKRLLHIIILLLWIVTSAQAQRYEYWLDGDYNNRVLATYGGGDVTASMDVSSLTPGLHFYNIRIQYGEGQWGSVRRYLFMVPGMAGEKAASSYEYWIDGAYAQKLTAVYNGGDINVTTDVSNLTDGIHYFNMRAKDKFGVWGPVNRYLFMVSGKNVLQPTAVEYWIDDRTSMTKSVNGSTIQLTVDISQLEAGIHKFYCRVQASNGKWSETYASEFTIEAPVLQEAFIEYYIDIDPGYGNANLVKEIEQGTNKISVDLANTADGAHVLYLRTRDEYGRWSASVARPLYVHHKSYENFVQMEYFFDDNDPGNGKAIPLSDFKTDMESLVSQLPITGLQAGSHTLNVRGMTEDGVWSSVITRPFIIIAVQPATPFVEYYFDIDPGYGKGFTIQNIEDGTSQLAIDLSGLLPGAHILYLRTNDKSRWSSTIARPLYVCRHTDIVALEYFFDDDDPGEGKATQVALPNNLSSTFTFEVPLNHLKVGDHLLHVRAKGNDGLWSVISTDAFAVTENTGINELYSNSIPTITYTLKGYQSMNEKGVNIIRYKDGRTRKVVKK